MEKKFRTHTCGILRKENIGEEVLLSGWVHSRRDHGGVIFIDLRDRYGITQLTFDPKRNSDAWKVADTLRSEYVISVRGVVSQRPESMINTSMLTGEIEVDGMELTILSKAETTPFEVSSSDGVSEDIRLKYRYLDLRYGLLPERIAFRSRVIKFIRDWMFGHDFLEIETPILTASSPEGARDFLVPSRLSPGMFYALPQAPQQYKQLLMVAGFDRYFQIAPCMRDEDARADRAPGEFYQLDVETSFLSQEEFFQLMEPLFVDLVDSLTDKKFQNRIFPRITFNDALNRFGSDKPDLRFGLELQDITEKFVSSGFKVFQNAQTIKGLCVKKGVSVIGRNEIDTVIIPMAQKYGAGGLAWMRMTDNGFESSITKFFSTEELAWLQKKFDVESGDYLFFVADSWKTACTALGAVRNYCGDRLGLKDPSLLAFAWIVDFPFFEFDKDKGKIEFSHNPFSMPQGGMDALLNKNPLDILAYQYDIICNGYELSSGAVRNYDSEIMYKAFEIAGYDKSVVDKKFGHMIKAFSFGAPPHCGFAPGIERTVMILAGASTIRDVTAFPKNSNGQDLMMGAPSAVDPEQLKDLGITLSI